MPEFKDKKIDKELLDSASQVLQEKIMYLKNISIKQYKIEYKQYKQEIKKSKKTKTA